MNILPISSHPLVPLSAVYSYDSILNLVPHYYENIDTGYYGVANSIFTGIKDVKIINDSVFYISSAVNLGDVIEDVADSFDLTDLVIYTGFKTKDSTYFKISGSTILGTEVDVAKRSMFRLIKLSDGFYNIVDINGKYWTIELEYPWRITLQQKFNTDTYNQQLFIIYFNDANEIYIKTKFKNIYYPTYSPEYYERYLAVSEVDGTVGAIGLILGERSDLLYETVDFSLGTYVKGYNPDSIYVKYYHELENPINNKNIEFKDIIRGTKNNFLIDSPYKTAVDESSKTINVNIANLKNIQTPEYEYTKAPYFENGTITQLTSANIVNAIKRREYNQLFMGSNQDRGYENPCLGFNADTKELHFNADKVTYFHYPKTAPNAVPIQYVGFTESGAIPGNTPARSDKVWKKLADYEKNIWWGNSTHYAVTPTSAINFPIQQGTWLCSWLSGNNTGSISGMWMDRWYYPGFATISDALTLDTAFLENTGIKVWDEPSQMTLDGGCWYKYFHFGNLENEKIVDALAGTGLTGLRLEYTKWNGSTVVDQSNYKNDGKIYNYSDSVVDGGVLNLNGEGQYCLAPYSSSYKLTDAITVTTRLNFNDWENIKGDHIISKGINNGWNLRGTNGYLTPTLVVFEKTYGHLMFINNDGQMYYDALYPVSAHPISGNFYGDPTALAMDGDLTIWATNNDENTKRLYRASYDGIINSEVIFDSTVNLTELTIDRNKNAWVLDISTNTVSGFSPDMSLIGTVEIDAVSAANRIDFDVNNVFLSGDYTILDRCIDSDNNIYELRSGATYIYKNNTAVIRSTDVTNIGCDSDGRLWLLKAGNKVVRTNSASTGAESTGTIGEYTTGQRRIAFTDEYHNGEKTTFAWILHSANNRLYKVDINCNLIMEINLSDYVDILSTKFSGQDRALMVFDFNGDNTGYEWQTKYVNHTPRIQADIILSQYLTGGITLSYQASNLVGDEYYNVSFTYDSKDGVANMYINTLLVDSASADIGSKIYYSNDNSMAVGAIMGVGNVINEEFDTDRYSTEGIISDLRIYDRALNNFDIKHIELLNYDFYDMTWNMPVGVQSFIEEIERFFKHKLPGLKSHFYNIRLSHLNITNLETRAIIEEIIRDTVKKVAPVYTELYKIIWD